MKHDPETLGHAVRVGRPLLTRFLAGFDDSNRTRQAPGVANHAAWTLGHLSLTWCRGAQKVDGGGLPEDLFLTGNGAGCDGRRFDTESVCYGSEPVDDPALYPAWERCRAVYDAAVERAASAIESATPERLGEEIDWGATRLALGDLVTRLMAHNGQHTGQIVDLRRGLGMGRVIG